MANFVKRGEKAQLKLWVDMRLREAIQECAETNQVSANAMAVMMLNQTIVGKPRYRVKMNRIVGEEL